MVTSKYIHIIWDWNGTLLNDAQMCVDVMNEQLTRRNLPHLTHERYAQVFDFPVRDYYAALGFDFNREPFETISDEFIAGYRARIEGCPLREGAHDAVKTAAQRGLTQSVLSAMEQTQLDHLLAHHGLRRYFTDVVGLPDHHAHGKTATGRAWLAEQTIPPEHMIFVGDTTHDVEVAQELGIDVVLVYSGHQSLERLKATGATVIGGLQELFQ